MQAYDSVRLEADIELGGTDQKFNLLAGRQLQIAMGQDPQVCITLPLLAGNDGRRMSKSLGNYLGVTEPPEEMFGKTMRIPDDLMVSWFRLATTLPEQEIDVIEQGLANESLHPGETKRRLAREIIALYHGGDAAEPAERHFDALHAGGRTAGADLAIVHIHARAPKVPLPSELFENGSIWVPKLLVLCGLASSNREGRKL